MTKCYKIIVIIIILLGFSVRLFALEAAPVGLNQDEASIGYEAYSLVNYGIDRNGQTWPIHFIAWGSGQNALYAYMIMPFIKLLGNTEIAVRLPMALTGCLTIVVVAIFLRELHIKPKSKLLILLLFAIMPWHIMKSRWGLESNIFPDLIIYSIILAYFGIKTKKKRYGLFSAIILGLSSYAYGTSYIFIPMSLLLAVILLMIKKQISWGVVAWYMLILTIVALPMVLFVVINYFELDSINILGFTVPRLDYNRFTSITSVNGNFLENCWNNLIGSIKIIFTQEDGLPLNYLKGFGIFYLFSLPFIIYGFILSLTKKYRSNIFLILNLSCIFGAFTVLVMTDPNINRINVLWLPMFTYLAFGIIDLTKQNNILYWAMTSLYTATFLVFLVTYFSDYQTEISLHMREGLGEAIDSIEASDYTKLYLTTEIDQPYIYYLFYTELNPNDYLRLREIPERRVMFQSVERIGDVYFKNPNNLLPGEIAIVKDDSRFDEECMREGYGEYIVVKCTKK